MEKELLAVREKYPDKFLILQTGNKYTIPFDDQWEQHKSLLNKREFGNADFENVLMRLLRSGVSVGVCGS